VVYTSITIQAYVTRLRSNSKHKIQLSESMFVLHGLWTSRVFFIQAQERRSVENRVQRRPFLKEDIDKLIRNHPRWCLEADSLRLNGSYRLLRGHWKERANAKLRRRLPRLLELMLEAIYKGQLVVPSDFSCCAYQSKACCLMCP
jgi:hypothetical protein